MKKPYKPRQKKAVKPVIATKIVRIDEKTEIEVSASTSDEDARERFWLRNKAYPRPKPIISTIPEADIDSISELEEMVIERDEGEMEAE